MPASFWINHYCLIRESLIALLLRNFEARSILVPFGCADRQLSPKVLRVKVGGVRKVISAVAVLLWSLISVLRVLRPSHF